MKKPTKNYFDQATKNNLSFIEYGPNKKMAVLRQRKEIFVNNTLQDEGDYMGFGYRIRSLEETAEFTQKLKQAGVPVPEIYEYGQDYIIEEYIEGEPLSEVFPKGLNIELANRFLNQVISAHRQGLVIAERWGKNEILTPKGEIVFIDLDVQYVCDFEKELELAEMVNAIVCFSKNHQMSEWLHRFLLSEEILSSYDVRKIFWLMQEHIEFWGDKRGYIATLLKPQHSTREVYREVGQFR